MEGMTDWYEIMLENGVGEHGCCLLCDDAKPGCLCYDCKCTQCLHYEIDDISGGYCTMTDELRNASRSIDKRYKIAQYDIETDKAILASIVVVRAKKLLPDKFWIPKSIIIYRIYVPRWFAEKTFKKVNKI